MAAPMYRPTRMGSCHMTRLNLSAGNNVHVSGAIAIFWPVVTQEIRGPCDCWLLICGHVMTLKSDPAMEGVRYDGD